MPQVSHEQLGAILLSWYRLASAIKALAYKLSPPVQAVREEQLSAQQS